MEYYKIIHGRKNISVYCLDGYGQKVSYHIPRDLWFQVTDLYPATYNDCAAAIWSDYTRVCDPLRFSLWVSFEHLREKLS